MASSKLDLTDQMNKPEPDQSTTLINSLDQIPGIGKKLHERLLAYYKEESVAIAAVKGGSIGIIPGISYKQALKLAQACFELEEQVKLEDLIKTPDCMDVYIHIKEIMANYLQSDYALAKLQSMIPLPPNKISLIHQRQAYFQQTLDFYNQYQEVLGTKEINQLLKRLGQFKTEDDLKRIRNRIIITESSVVKDFLITNELDNIIPSELIQIDKITNPESFFQEYSRNFEVVLYFGNSENALPDFPNLLEYSVKDLIIETVCPERIIQKFGLNKGVIQACIKLVVLLKNLKETTLLQAFLPEFDVKLIKTIKANIEIINNDGTILESIDPKLDEYRDIAKRFPAIVNEIEQEINEEIRGEVSDRSIHFDGKQILELYRSDLTVENVRNYIPPEVDEIINDAIQNGITKLGIALHLEKNELEQLSTVIPELIEFPINLKPEGISLLEKKIQSRVGTYNFIAMQRIAKQLQESYEYLLHLIQVLLDFDFFYGMGHFANDFHLSIPQITEDSQFGLQASHMNNLDLMMAEKQGELNAIPIDYQIGTIGDVQIPKAHLNLLTGSNSGGKTVCLTTILQTVLLAQMGIPTLGETHFFPFEELYFFKKSTGQLTAGAFETTLLQFVELSNSPKLKLVLADELEAITEPNAAAKVMAGMFDLFLEQPQNYGVFVTHLVEMIVLELTDAQRNAIRIDGIEASGLDEQLNLVIDRNPRINYIAKSTPELILKRLSSTGENSQRNFFRTILNRFNKIET